MCRAICATPKRNVLSSVQNGVRWIWICLFACLVLADVQAQGTLAKIDALDLPDTAKIDRITDQAWTLARVSPDTAEALAHAAIRRADAANYPKGLINANILLGILNKDRGYYGLSVEHHLSALQLAEANGDSLRVSGCLNNLGSVFQEQGNYLKALSYFQRSLSIEDKLGNDKAQTSIRLFNIGEAYHKLDSLDKAAAFYYNSLLIEEELKSEEGIFYARLGIGKVATRKGDLANAQSDLERALAYALDLENHPGICETQVALGELYRAQGRFPAAEAALDSAITLARAFRYQGLEMQALGSRYQLLKTRQDFAAANATLEAYHTLRDKVNSATVNSRIGELQMRYELKKKEQEITLFMKNEELQAAQVKYERRLRNYLLFTIAFAALLILYTLWRQRNTHSSEEEGLHE
jgi:tetratricopeptide (TPR) repeat protein